MARRYDTGGFLVYGRSVLGQSATSEPAPELLRRANAVIDNGGVDLEATDLIRVARQPKPHVVDLQHRRALRGKTSAMTAWLPPGKDGLSTASFVPPTPGSGTASAASGQRRAVLRAGSARRADGGV